MKTGFTVLLAFDVEFREPYRQHDLNMDSLLARTLLKLLPPLVGAGAVVLVSSKRRPRWRDELGWRAPKPVALLGWIAVWVVWIAVSELCLRLLGMGPPKPWPAYPLLIVILRVAAIGMAGPLSEEIIARGFLFGRLKDTRLGPWGAIVLVSLLWTAMHYRYGPATLAFVFLDGLLLGAARHTTSSIWPPVAMHTIGNLFSIFQSLTG